MTPRRIAWSLALLTIAGLVVYLCLLVFVGPNQAENRLQFALANAAKIRVEAEGLEGLGLKGSIREEFVDEQTLAGFRREMSGREPAAIGPYYLRNAFRVTLIDDEGRELTVDLGYYDAVVTWWGFPYVSERHDRMFGEFLIERCRARQQKRNVQDKAK